MKNKSGKISIINTQYGRFYLTDIKTAIKIFDYKGYIKYFEMFALWKCLFSKE